MVRSDRPLSCSFALAVPCPLSASGTVTLDTTRLADGEHDLELILSDATLANHVRHGPVRIVVDNVPPPLATSLPRIYGTASEGVTLYADDGTWSGEGLTVTRRWQRHEDGEWQDIAGADGAAYAPTARDAGHRLRFRVRASNAEGATDAYSLPTRAAAVSRAAAVCPRPRCAATRAPASAAPARRGAGRCRPQPLVAFPTAAFQSTGGSTITVRWGERRRVSGTLLRPDGRPVAGARLAVTSRARTLDAQPIAVGHVTTDGRVASATSVGSGVSRVISFGFRDSAALRTAQVTIRVIPRVTLRATAGGRVEGRVVGAPPGLRKVVELQVIPAAAGARWRRPPRRHGRHLRLPPTQSRGRRARRSVRAARSRLRVPGRPLARATAGCALFRDRGDVAGPSRGRAGRRVTRARPGARAELDGTRASWPRRVLSGVRGAQEALAAPTRSRRQGC